MSTQVLRYSLIVLNDQGASDETKHSTKAGVRRQIRTWEKGMTARVIDADGRTVYEGSAYSF